MGFALLAALGAALLCASLSPPSSEATKVYYCNQDVLTGRWCGNDTVRRPYWLQVGCVVLRPTDDCHSSDYTYWDRQFLCQATTANWRAVIQAIEPGPKQRYSAAGCLIAGWYHPENLRGVIPLVTHIGKANGPVTLHLKGWACWGGDPQRLNC